MNKDWIRFSDRFGLKIITCEKHGRRVFHPVGQPCPVCHPDLYAGNGTGPESKVFYIVPEAELND